MPFNPFGTITALLNELLVGQANIASRIGALKLSTQQDAENLAQAIAANTTAWQSWATTIEGILTNVENALTAAQQQITNGGTVDLTDAQTALTAAQNAVTALPVETDPTVAPTPDPNSGS